MEKRRIEEIRGSAAKAKGVLIGKVSKLHKAKTGVGCDGFHTKVLLHVTKETRGENRGVLGEFGTKWKVAATSMYDDVLLDTAECHESEANRADADVDTLVRSFEGS